MAKQSNIKKNSRFSPPGNPPSEPMIAAAKLAIKNTDWDAYWRKVDAAVSVECDAYREARRKSMEEMGRPLKAKE